MVVKSCFLGTLKQKKSWKQSPNFFSSFSHPSDVVSTNISITRQCDNGRLDIARQLFDEMPNRTVVSWNAMICGYSKWGHRKEALSLFSDMHRSNVGPTETTFSKILSACGRWRAVEEGREVHCLVVKSGAQSLAIVGCSLLHFYANCSGMGDAKLVFLELRGLNYKLWSVMLACYAQCGMLRDALCVLEAMPKRDVVAWTALISGHAKSEDGCERALELFQWMRCDQVVPNEFTLDCVIRAFGRLALLREGKAVHGLVVKYGLEFEHSISGTLIEFYFGCESVGCAKKVYDELVDPCVNASSSIMAGLVLMGSIEEAEMIFEGLKDRDSVCCNLMIKGYAMSGQVEESKRLFERMRHKTIVSLNTMIDVYSRNGEIENAVALFEEAKGEKDPVTWNAMISGFVQNCLYEEALKLYLTMCILSINCTRSTFSVLLHMCSCLGSLQLGQSLHAHLIKTVLQLDVFVGTSLVDMYSKCGSIKDAYSSFTFTSSPNMATWTALINGYAIHGQGSIALAHFACMLTQGIAPNAATFVAILCACRHSSLINQGMRIFHSMRTYNINPSLEHYACIVDLLGRAGRLEEAVIFIEKMPIEADAVIWGALLSACWFWMDMRLGEKVAEKMFDSEPKPLYAYVVLSNIYGVLGKWVERAEMRKRMKSFRARRSPGCSWIELNGRVHLFYVEDKSHPQCNVIYSTLDHITTNVNSFDED